MRVVTGDFETYYDSEYSLRKITTEEYIRDARFEAILFVAQVNDEPPRVAWGEEAIKQLVHDLQLDRKDTVFIAHNARFDGSIVEWRYGVKINMLLCTQLMMRETGLARITSESLSSLAEFLRKQGYAVPPKGHAVSLAAGQHYADMSSQFRKEYEEYCQTDNAILRAAAKLLMPLCTSDALQSINMTLQMYTRPVLYLNEKLLCEYLQQQQREREATLQQLVNYFSFADTEELLQHLRSKAKFAELLKQLGVEPPQKLSEKKTEKAGEPVYDYAFAKSDLAFTELLSHDNPQVQRLVEARLGYNSSIAESRTKAFLDIARRGKLPVPLEYAKAHTGRYGGSDKINLQNLPKRAGNKTLRTAIQAPAGYELGGADSSQIEARLLAYVAQETDLLNVFATGGDPYCYMAASIYGESAELIRQKAKQEHDPVYIIKRNVGKETVLASGYGMSANKFALRLRQQGIEFTLSEQELQQLSHTVPLTSAAGAVDAYVAAYHETECQRINQIYRNKHLRITGFWKVCEQVLIAMLRGQNGFFGGPDGKMFYFDGKHTILGAQVPGIRLPNGYWLVYYNLRVVQEETPEGYLRNQYVYDFKQGRNFIPKRIYGGALTENLIQALAFAVLKWQAINIHKSLPVRLNVHDEWVSIYKTEQRAAAEQLYTYWMKQTPDWLGPAPLDCEFSYGATYGDL